MPLDSPTLVTMPLAFAAWLWFPLQDHCRQSAMDRLRLTEQRLSIRAMDGNLAPRAVN